MTEMRLKLLMISHPFPPIGGLASIRTVQFANQLVERGHCVRVLSIGPSRQYPRYDEALVHKIDPKVKVYRTYAGVLHQARYNKRWLLSDWLESDSTKWLTKIRHFALVQAVFPLSNLEWLLWALIPAYSLVKTKRYNAVYSSGNPFVTHLIAYVLKKCHNIPWAMYIGDPYSFGAQEQRRPVWRKRIDAVLDELCLNAADRIIVNCNETLDGYLQRFPRLNPQKFIIITDGFDAQAYRNATPITSERFRLVYTGALHDSVRDLSPLFSALAACGIPELEFVIAGNITPSQKKMIREFKLETAVRPLGYRPHSEIVSLQKGASVLVLLGWAGGVQVPGKLYEYLGAQRPILAVTFDPSDPAAKMVQRYGRGIVVENQAHALKEAITRLYMQWKVGKINQSYSLAILPQFSWDVITKLFEQVVGEITNGNRR